jgi:integrase/recombinase XerD
MRNDLHIKNYLNLSRGKGNRHQVYVRLTYQRKKAEIATSIYLEDSEWNPHRERAVRNNSVDSELAQMEGELRKIKQHLEYENREISAKIIKDIHQGNDTVTAYLLDRYETYIENLKTTSHISKGTWTTYNKTYRLVKDFMQATRKSDMNVKDIRLKLIEEFDRYMNTLNRGKNGNPLMVNTIAKHHARFRTYLIQLEKHGLIEKSPYVHFKLKYEESERTFLTREELARFENHDLGGNHSLERIKDIFIFSVYTGFRFGDCKKATTAQLIESNGKHYISHREGKHRKFNQIPLLPPVKAIIDKYADTPERSFGKLLPVISNQKLNDYIKVIADLAQIKDKVVTHHVARHTCATTVLLENGVPIEIVQAWLNHANIRETMIYAKLTNRLVNQSTNVEALFEKFGVRPSVPV